MWGLGGGPVTALRYVVPADTVVSADAKVWGGVGKFEEVWRVGVGLWGGSGNGAALRRAGGHGGFGGRQGVGRCEKADKAVALYYTGRPVLANTWSAGVLYYCTAAVSDDSGLAPTSALVWLLLHYLQYSLPLPSPTTRGLMQCWHPSDHLQRTCPRLCSGAVAHTPLQF